MALRKKVEDFARALDRLEEAYRKTEDHREDGLYSFLRDSTIQRFEFTLEIGWKTIKSYLLEIEGVECRSPKSCIREFFSSGHLDSEATTLLLGMTDDRNLATHTYHESVAEEIFAHIGSYLPILRKLYRELSKSGSF